MLDQSVACNFSLSNVPVVANRADHSASDATQNRKILHLINGEHFSGAERVQDLLAAAMPQFGYQVSFACVKPGKFSEVRHSDCDLFETPMRNKLDVWCAGRVRKLFRDGGFELIHAHTPRTLMIGALAAKHLGCPLVYHVHSPVGRDSERGLTNRVNTWIETWSLRQVDRMICVSRSLGEYMQQLGHSETKIRVVNNGVAEVTQLPPRELPTEPWILGTMALFRPRKGTEVLLEALAILKRDKAPVVLRAVGPFEHQDYQREIIRHAERLGVSEMIQWMGFQADVDQQLQQMDLFILPSLYGEGLPMVVLEAMANGVPVVASRVEGIPEAVRDQIDGLIFAPADPQDLADKLKLLIGDRNRWQSMSRSSLQRQRDHLSDVSMAAGVASVYEELLG